MIHRPVKSWSVSAQCFGGYPRLLWAIFRCYLGWHVWGNIFCMDRLEVGKACLVCDKWKEKTSDKA